MAKFKKGERIWVEGRIIERLGKKSYSVDMGGLGRFVLGENQMLILPPRSPQ